MLVSIIVLSVLAYLLGSIPTSIWVSKSVFKIDIRNYGSGNAGATNSFRFLGKKWAIFILFIDISKGYLAVNLANFQHDLDNSPTLFLNFKLFLGLLAIIGHIYPIFEKFRGGKGIATMYGVIIAISPQFALVVAVVFFLVFGLTHYVALGSMIGAATFTLAIYFFSKDHHIVASILATLCTLLVIFKHHINITRIINGTETKMYLFRKNKEKLSKSCEEKNKEHNET